MADERFVLEIAEANFNLLADSDDLNECNLEEEITEEDIEHVQNIIAQAESQNQAENDDSMDDFADAQTSSRHASANEAKLNFYADANHRDTTKQQTKWAVNLFTGNYDIFSEIYVLFLNIKFCSRR